MTKAENEPSADERYPVRGKICKQFQREYGEAPDRDATRDPVFGPAVIGESPSEPSPSKFQREPGAALSAAADLQGAMMSVHYPLHDRQPDTGTVGSLVIRPPEAPF